MVEQYIGTSIRIRPDQVILVKDLGVDLSGWIRDMIDAYFLNEKEFQAKIESKKNELSILENMKRMVEEKAKDKKIAKEKAEEDQFQKEKKKKDNLINFIFEIYNVTKEESISLAEEFCYQNECLNVFMEQKQIPERESSAPSLKIKCKETEDD